MILKVLVELIGTFIFLSVIRTTNGDPIAVGVALIAAIFFGGKVSGGHFNPAVTVMQTVDGKLSLIEAIPYIISQVIGGLAALRYFTISGIEKGNMNNLLVNNSTNNS